MPPDLDQPRRSVMRAFLLAHTVASYVAGPVFVALEVFYYRPIHWSSPDARVGAVFVAALSPLSAPLLLVGTPLGIALHHGPLRPVWFAVGVGYVALEIIFFRMFRSKKGSAARSHF